jgi:beta-phosphoglucomutase
MPGGNGAVVWDMDGTLVDTAELHFRAWEKLMAQLNRPFTRRDFAATFGQRNPEILTQLVGTHLSAEELADLGDRKEVMYRAEARQGVTLLPGVLALLEGLQSAGFRQAIGSSAPRANLELILELTGAERFFGAVVSMEDTQRGKPDPQVFQVAAARLGVPAGQCVVMEDAVAGVQAARAGGMKCVAVAFVGHHPPQTLQAAGADLVVPTLEAVSVETIRRLLGG